jgi:hypothetical protein
MGEALARFRQDQEQSRERLRRAAVAVLASEGALAVHQLGSLARGTGDELSDLDLWATFRDHDLASVVARRTAAYARVAPIVMVHEAPRNRPVGGSYSLVIYETPTGLCQVDYYLAARSASPVPPEGVLWSGVELPRGEWNLDLNASGEDTPVERVAFLACMTFILAKGVRRGAEPAFFARTREAVAARTGARDLPTSFTYATLIRMTERLAEVATPAQRAALTKLGAYLAKLASLYG